MKPKGKIYMWVQWSGTKEKKKNKGKVSVYEITWSDLQETSFQARCIREQHVIQEWEAEWYTKTQEWEAVR